MPATAVARHRIDTTRCYSAKKLPDINAIAAKLADENPAIAEYGEAFVARTFEVLLNAGFGIDECVYMVNEYPALLHIQRADLESRLEMWKVCQMTKTQYFNLFTEQPALLECDNEAYLANRWAKLQQIAWTTKNVWRLLIQSPNVLFDDMHSIKAKADYILDTMKADVTDLVKSGSLSLPLEKIIARHVLLHRLGIYKKPNPKASEMDPNKNPRLARIMDSSDDEFASKVCGITIGELEVFYELHERELKEVEKERVDYEEDTDGEYDEDDSDEEYNFDPREQTDYYDDRQKRKYQKQERQKD